MALRRGGCRGGAEAVKGDGMPDVEGSQRVPSPRESLLLGSAGAFRRDQLGTYERAMRSCGDTARFRIGPPGVGFVFDTTFHPDGAREVLTGREYVKDAPVFTELRRMMGDGIVTSNGDRWRRDRRLLQPLFTRQRVATHVEVIAQAAEDLVGWWAPDARAGRPVDLHAESMRYALHALGVTVFGKDMAVAEPTVLAALPVMRDYIARRALAPVRMPAAVPTPANRRAEQARRSMADLVGELLAQRRAEGDEEQDDLLGRLLQARDPEQGRGLDDAELRAQAVTLLIAGHETTGSALAFALHLLGLHQGVQDRVRAEISDVLGDRPAAGSDVKALRYTAQVVDEAMRLYPPAHTLPRRAGAPTRLMGHEIPEGRIVAVSVWGIHHNPKVWAEPDRFDPDRFTEEQGVHRERYKHLAFGGGPRTCVGVHLALLELVIGVATVVRAYRLRSAVADPVVDAGVTLHPAQGLPCVLEPVGA
jgi:cytochrome P450